MSASTPPARRDFANKTHRTTYPYISPSDLDLTGRRVLITGTANSDGVGYATALAYARAGASTIGLADLHNVNDELAQGLKAVAREAGRQEPVVQCYKVDISLPSSVSELRTRVLHDFDNRLDVLVNNAAHQEPYEKLLDSDYETEWKTWKVNVGGFLIMTRAFLPTLLAGRDRGKIEARSSDLGERNIVTSTSSDTVKETANPSDAAINTDLDSSAGLCTIINVSSSGALTPRTANDSYRTSKLAILRLTESLFLDYAPLGLVTYSINPGAIRTQMTVNEPPEIRDRLPHTPELAGDTIVWLSSERREWLGGRYVSCPWDMEELMERREEIEDRDKLKMRMVF